MPTVTICRGETTCEAIINSRSWYANDAGVMVSATALVETPVGGGEFDKYVSPTGSNGGTGTQGDPYETITHAVTQMSGGESLGLLNGTYTEAISTIPANLTIQAVNDGQVTLTGSFNLGNNVATLQGMIVQSNNTKYPGSNKTLRRMSFVGGPACGDTTNVTCGIGITNTDFIECAFYGGGGRYMLLCYQASNITLTDVIFRPDGGWGEGSSGCTAWEPNASWAFYESTGCTATRVVVLDGIVTAHSSSESLGGIAINSRSTTNNAGTCTECVIVNNEQGGFTANGNGTANGTVFTDCAAVDAVVSSYYSFNHHVGGTSSVVRMLSNGSCGNWDGGVTHTNSLMTGGQSSGCSGTLNGDGANITLNSDFLNEARWATEIKGERGGDWGTSGDSLSDYIQSYLDSV